MSELSQRLRELLAKSTPGPWLVCDEMTPRWVFREGDGSGWKANKANDAAFVAFMQNNAETIIAALEAAAKGESK